MKKFMHYLTTLSLFPLAELSTGLLTFAHFGHKDNMDAKVSPSIAHSTAGHCFTVAFLVILHLTYCFSSYLESNNKSVLFIFSVLNNYSNVFVGIKI